MINTIDTRNEKHAKFIGNSLDNLHVRDLAEQQFRKLLIPNNPEYYEITQRDIVDVDGLIELVVKFTTDFPVTIQYNDMMISDVKSISIMPNIDNAGSYIVICGENEIELGMIIPDNDTYCLLVNDVRIEEELMLFLNLEVLYYNTPNNKYPYMWVEHIKDQEEGNHYELQAKLHPLCAKSIILHQYDEEEVQIFSDINSMLQRLSNSMELSVLPYSSILVDDNFECYSVLCINDHYLDCRHLGSGENIAIPYTDFANFETNYQFKYYIDKNPMVIYADPNGGKYILEIINNKPNNDERVQEILGALYDSYDTICNPEIMQIDESFEKFLSDANIEGCIIVDAQHNQLLLLNAKTKNYTRVI